MSPSDLDADLREVLAPGFPGEVSSRSVDELRALRARCEAHEEAVSYVRRLLHGRLDILRAELQQRREHGDGAAADLLASLPSILATDPVTPPSRRAVRATRLRVPETAAPLLQRVEEVAGPVVLSGLGGMDLAALGEVVGRLEDLERELSIVRKQLFDRIDALRDELAARYKDGRADVRDLLVGPSGDS